MSRNDKLSLGLPKIKGFEIFIHGYFYTDSSVFTPRSRLEKILLHVYTVFVEVPWVDGIIGVNVNREAILRIAFRVDGVYLIGSHTFLFLLEMLLST